MVSTPIGAPSATNIPNNTFKYPTPIVQPLPTAPPQQLLQSTVQPPIPLPALPTSTTPLVQHTVPNFQPTIPYISNMPNLLVNTLSSQGHTFPVLYSQPPTEIQSISIYSEYLGNPYNNLVSRETNVNCTIPNQNIIIDNQQPTPPPLQTTNVVDVQELDNCNINLQSNIQNSLYSLDVNQQQSSEDLNRNPQSNQTTSEDSVDNNLEVQPNCQTNIFQSSNYFRSDTGSDFIPPGSEILFTTEQKSQSSLIYDPNLVQGINIPNLDSTTN